MKKIFTLCAAVLMAVGAMAGRTFDGTEVLYLNAGAVGWWQDGNAVQIATFDGETKVVGEKANDPTKVGFTVPAGTYSTVVFSRHSSADADPWNKTGEISFDGSEGKNMVETFEQNSSDVTWGNYSGEEQKKAECPDALYMIGNIENVGWVAYAGIEMVKSGNKFTATANFVPDGTNTTCWFCFSATNNHEDTTTRFGAGYLEDGKAVSISGPGDLTATIAPGNYTITIDWDAYTVTATTATTALENAEVSVKAVKRIVNGQMVIVRGEQVYSLTGAAL